MKTSLLSLSEYPARRFQTFADELTANNFSTIRLKDIATNSAINGHTVLLSFDDAFESVFQNAAPILKQHNLTATIFAVAGFLGKHSTWDVYSRRRHCGPEQIRQLSTWGFEIGSHSLTHPNLCWLNDADLWREVADSKKILEDCLGKSVTSFSFPFGFWNKRVWETVLKAGYTAATAYRGAEASEDHRLLPVYGVYRFDSVKAIFDKIDGSKKYSLALAQSRIMAHFSKGGAIIKRPKNKNS